MENEFAVIANIGLAFVLGGLIGLEREASNKPAGFRTHMLVAGAVALLVNLGHPLLAQYGSGAAGGFLRADPLRLFEAIITGIAFLGAGTIIRRTEDGGVEGLTTASSILMAGVIGICVALHQFVLALAGTTLTLVSLRLMRLVERHLGYKNRTEKKKKE